MTVQQLVERERTRVRRLHVVAGVALAVAASLGVLAVAAVVLGDLRWVRLPRPVPFAVWIGLLAANAWVLRRTRRALAREGARGEVAAAIEREQSLRAGALRGAIEVADAGALGRRHASELASRLGGRRALAPALSARARVRSLRAGGAAVASLLLLLAIVPLFGDGLSAALLPVRAWRGTLLPPLRLVDVPAEVVRGERIAVVVPAPGRDRITIAVRLTGERWRTIEARVDPGTERATATIGPIDATTTLVATDGRSSSDTAVVRVTDRPFVGNVSVRAIYPAYLGRAPEQLPPGEPARVPRGTVLDMRGRASTALARIALVGGRDTVLLRPDRHAFSGRLVAARSGTWRWEASGAAGPIADVPAPLDLDVVPDSAPSIELVAPRADTVVSPSGVVALRIVAADDHGLREVVLRARRIAASGRELPAESQRIADAPPAPWMGEASLDLGARGLEPGDALRVVVEAVDDSPWRQRATSRELVLRVPTRSEQRALARAAADSTVASVTQAAQEQRRLERETGNAARARESRESRESGTPRSSSARTASGREMSFDGAERARRVLEEQRALQEQVRQARETAQALEEQLRRAGALDTALARQLAEARELLAQALTPEMERQLRELQDALQQLSADDARQALSELAEQQRRLREQLERSAEMLKRAALEGAMQTLRDEARELAGEQRNMADSLRSGEAEARDAAALAERSRRLAEDVKELQRRLDAANAETGARQASAAREHAEASGEAMQRAAERARHEEPQGREGRQGREGQPSAQAPSAARQNRAESASAAEQASRAMEQAAQELAEARARQIDEWKRELSSEIDQSVQELTQLAREEQRLEERVRQGESGETLRAAQGALQQGVERASDRLQQAGRQSSLLSQQSQRQVAEARRKVADATETLSQGSGSSQSASALRQASEALNRAAAALVRDRERVNAAKSASGFEEMIQQMQELAKQQGQLNAQSQGLMGMPSSQGGPGGDQAREAARRLARQQRALGEALDEAAEMSDAGAARAKQMAEEARRIAAALEGGQIDQGTLARQERLFRRMLDAGKSLEKEEREDTDTREARAAEGVDPFAPAAGGARGASATRFREPSWEELRGLSPEERSAVIEYFRRINAQQAP